MTKFFDPAQRRHQVGPVTSCQEDGAEPDCIRNVARLKPVAICGWSQTLLVLDHVFLKMTEVSFKFPHRKHGLEARPPETT